MRIDLNPGRQSLAESNRCAEQAVPTSSSATRVSEGESEDQAELSGAYCQVQALAAQASKLPEVRQERVRYLRQAMQSGLYTSTPEQVAGAMFEHMIIGTAA
jgi:flagellar biosynthesis anti-sigma factor FlgM